MTRPRVPDFHHLAELLGLYARLQLDHSASGVTPLLSRAERDLEKTIRLVRKRAPGSKQMGEEPDDLEAIRALRPEREARALWPRFLPDLYSDRLKGALLGRMAGCTLGAPVELWPVDRMERLAAENSDKFPPTDYWRYVYDPGCVRYGLSRVSEYTRDGMNGAPVDDDIAYTLMGLLVAERHGLGFSTADVAAEWIALLPMACTAEDVALKNLKAGVSPDEAGAIDNPFCEWIGAAIRADPWAYMAPGQPELAAELAWRDARLSHRRNGIYGEMFWAAAISAAFAVDDPVEALRIGLGEIPRDCRLAREIRWALKIAPTIRDHRQARAAVEQRFPGMHAVHTINNACLTAWGITIGGKDFTRVISETVAMGLDNDCTAATAGSLVGAVVGVAGIPKHWFCPFHDTVWSYLKGKRRFSIKGLLRRFEKLARASFRPTRDSGRRRS